MAGNAKSDMFMLGTATVMLGAPEDLYDLNPEAHSVGLVKNFTLEGTKERTELTQGTTNDVVFTLTTGATTRGSFEMYEYTEKNMAYALGLEGSSLTTATGDAHVTSGAVSFSGGSATLALVNGVGQDIKVGNHVSIRDPGTENIVLAEVTSVSGITSGTASTATIDVEIPDSNSTLAIPAGSFVTVINILQVGSTDVDRNYSAKVCGQLANGTWITLLFPKVRVSSGLSMSFGTDNFGNIPFEFTPLKITNSDPFYTKFKGTAGFLASDSVQSPLA